MSEKYPRRRSATEPLDKSSALPASNNAFWYLASEKLVTQTEGAQAGSGSLPPPQAVSVTARMAALDMEVQKKARFLFGMVMILLRLKVSRLNIVAPYDGIKSLMSRRGRGLRLSLRRTGGRI